MIPIEIAIAKNSEQIAQLADNMLQDIGPQDFNRLSETVGSLILRRFHERSQSAGMFGRMKPPFRRKKA